MSRYARAGQLEPLGEDELLALARPVRRVAARLAPYDADDVVQETLARLLEVSGRVDRATLPSYAVVTAKNYMASQDRARDRAHRHAHRLLDLAGDGGPDEAVLREEERAALRTALTRLADADARLLLAYELGDVDTAGLAAGTGVTPGAIAARLSRARARLRLEYFLALRKVVLPTARCRPVLLAMSAGDRRRQRALHAQAHLLRCPACSALRQPLLARRRELAALLPVVLGPLLSGPGGAGSTAGAEVGAGAGASLGAEAGAGAGGGIDAGSMPNTQPLTATSDGDAPAPERSRSRQVVAWLAGLAAVGAATLALRADAPLASTVDAAPPRAALPLAAPPLNATPSAAAAPRSMPTAPRVAPAPATRLAPAPTPAPGRLRAGGPRPSARQPGGAGAVQVRGRVVAVPADEGFWLRSGPTLRWVQLRGRGESPVTIRPGQLLDLRGQVRPVRPGFAASVGVGPAEGADRLRRSGRVLSVPYASVRVVRTG